MNPDSKLLLIKILHTVIWAFFVVVIFYVLYSGITDTVNRYTWIGILVVIGEGITLAIFNKFCPLTLIARKYSDSQKDNFDIFLPNWLAKHNKVNDFLKILNCPIASLSTFTFSGTNLALSVCSSVLPG